MQDKLPVTLVDKVPTRIDFELYRWRLLDGSPQPQLAKVSGGYHCCFNIENSHGKPTQPCATSGTASGTALLANLHLHASRTTTRSFCGLSAERRESSHDNGSSKILGQPKCLKSALQRKSITCRLACKLSKGHTRRLWSLYNWRTWSQWRKEVRGGERWICCILWPAYIVSTIALKASMSVWNSMHQ